MTAVLLDLELKMAALARSFPCIAKAPAVKLWDANGLDQWASEVPIFHGELVTVRFLLAVWDPDFYWRCARFDLMETLRAWDEAHRAAFLAWASDPWWP